MGELTSLTCVVFVVNRSWVWAVNRAKVLEIAKEVCKCKFTNVHVHGVVINEVLVNFRQMPKEQTLLMTLFKKQSIQVKPVPLAEKACSVDCSRYHSS